MKSRLLEIRCHLHVTAVTQRIFGVDPEATKEILLWFNFIRVEEVRRRLESWDLSILENLLRSPNWLRHLDEQWYWEGRQAVRWDTVISSLGSSHKGTIFPSSLLWDVMFQVTGPIEEMLFSIIYLKIQDVLLKCYIFSTIPSIKEHQQFIFVLVVLHRWFFYLQGLWVTKFSTCIP